MNHPQPTRAHLPETPASCPGGISSVDAPFLHVKLTPLVNTSHPARYKMKQNPILAPALRLHPDEDNWGFVCVYS